MIPNLDQPDVTVGIVGAGTMGRGIAQMAVVAGYRALLTDQFPAAAEDARAFISRMALRAAEKGRMTREAAETALGRLHLVPHLDDLKDCAIVIEAIVEDLVSKRKLFAELEAIVSDDCILASNTSALSITAIAAVCRRPARVAGAHFFNPVPLMKLVEVVDGEHTEPRVGDALMAFVGRLGHKAVRVKDVPLFLVNHVGRGYSTEALAILEEGVAAPVDIDRVMREVAGFPMGPFELLDLTALDVSHRSMESSFTQFYSEPRMRPSPETKRRLEAGLLGRKTGAGFYRYQDGKIVMPPEPAGPSRLPRAVWISPADAAAQDKAHRCLAGLRDTVRLELGDRPSSEALCLVTPLGADATTSAVDQKLDPGHTLAIDTLLDLTPRVTLMATPATESRYREEGHGLFATAGYNVTLIADSPGFIVPRILASIVNIACAIAQQGIGTPDDIDEAVRIGRGYPQGPLSLGDSLGAGRVLTILEALQGLTGDPRYRPSLWLRRRVQLGLSLQTPDLAP
ncbi:MAG: 3-hydroxyacyl-CoA dehydrogenase [Pseudomonadota bacterium]|nr:3-hydroxyacyl-CoA dehydrogenase [Pseudomonadota bacterium]